MQDMAANSWAPVLQALQSAGWTRP